MFKSLNRGISAPIAIIIIVVCALLVGGIVVWQYYGIPKEEEKTPEELPTNETPDWETYRNEEYGFEIDYPADGWEFEEYYRGAPTIFGLCKEQVENEKEEICIFATIKIIYYKCHDLSLTEIIENSECFMQYAWLMHFEEEVITDSGVKGVRAEGLDGAEEAVGVFFLIPGKVFDDQTYPVLFFEYFLGPWGHPEIRYPFASEKKAILNQMISTFRFIEPTEEEINYKNILEKMFPEGEFIKSEKNQCFKDEVKYPNFWEYFGYRIYCLEEIFEGSFIKTGEENLLFVFDYNVSTGWPHAAGLDHKYLTIFDIKGEKLLVEPSEFINDKIDFAFYSCKGITYILSTSKRGTTGGLSGNVELIQVKDREFKTIWNKFELAKEWNFDPYHDAIIAEAKEDGLIIYKKEKIEPDFVCPTECIEVSSNETFIYWGELYWDKDACKFKTGEITH